MRREVLYLIAVILIVLILFYLYLSVKAAYNTKNTGCHIFISVLITLIYVSLVLYLFL